MTASELIKTSDKVVAAFSNWKKGAIAKELGMSRNTLKARIKNNGWSDEERETLKRIGVL